MCSRRHRIEADRKPFQQRGLAAAILAHKKCDGCRERERLEVAHQRQRPWEALWIDCRTRPAAQFSQEWCRHTEASQVTAGKMSVSAKLVPLKSSGRSRTFASA